MKFCKNHLVLVILTILSVLTLYCSWSSRCSEPHPQDVFEKYVISPIPKLCRAFDCRIVKYFPGATAWVAFDAYDDDWGFLVKKLGLAIGSKKNLKFASGKTPNDTGFEGYLDDEDYQTLEDTCGGSFLVRKMKERYVRVIFFKRF